MPITEHVSNEQMKIFEENFSSFENFFDSEKKYSYSQHSLKMYKELVIRQQTLSSEICSIT